MDCILPLRKVVKICGVHKKETHIVEWVLDIGRE